MKILHIIDNLGMGGANSLLVTLAREQLKMGHLVTILCLIKAKSDVLENKAILSGIKVITLQEKGSVYNPCLIFKISKQLKGYDVINAHLTPAEQWTGLAKMIAGFKHPMFVTVHSTNGHKRFDGAFKYIDRFIYSHFYDEVIACADKVKNILDQKFQGLKIVSIPNGIEFSKFKEAIPISKNAIGCTEDDIIVTMVARFSWMKRQDTVVEAISLLPEKYHAVFVGGDGGEMDKIKDLVADKNVGNRVHFLGIRPDVPEILKTSDILVMASDFEGLSISSLEGMASGKPFVASNVDGLREVVGGAGVLFENRNAKDLAEIINKLSEDKKYCHSVIDRCIEKARQYDICKVALQYVDRYNSVKKYE